LKIVRTLVLFSEYSFAAEVLVILPIIRHLCENHLFMKIPETVFNRDTFYADLVRLLDDQDCFILIDTNILASFFRLHEQARTELINWMAPFISSGRLKTPAWAMNEYTKKLVRDKLSEYLSNRNKLATINSDFKEARKFLSLHINPAQLPPDIYSESQAYLNDLSNVENGIQRLQNLVKKTDTRYIQMVNDLLMATFNGTVLQSDIFALAEQVTVKGPVLFRNELPPGFEDKGKDLNPFGDLIIWEEILAFAKKEQAKKVIFLTNDHKRDWMYTPQRITINNIAGPNRGNFKVLDPRLAFQFQLAGGSDDIHVINLETLTHILMDAGRGMDLYQLAKALQIEWPVGEDEQPESGTATAVEEAGNGTPPSDAVKLTDVTVTEAAEENPRVEESENLTELVSIAEAAKGAKVMEETQVTVANEPAGLPAGIYKRTALADKTYEAFDHQSIAQIVTDLRSHNWYKQNPAIDRTLELFVSSGVAYSKDDLFVLGRNVYQAACGGAYAAVQYIEDQGFEQIGNSSVQAHLISGMLYEIFFNGGGQLRRPAYKAAFLDQVFILLSKATYQPALSFINSALTPFAGGLLMQPSAAGQPILFNISLTTQVENDFGEGYEVQVVSGIQVNGEELLQVNNGSVSHTMKTYLYTKDIVNEIKQAFGIPSFYQEIHFEPPMTTQILLAKPNTVLWRGDLPPAPKVEETGF